MQVWLAAGQISGGRLGHAALYSSIPNNYQQTLKRLSKERQKVVKRDRLSEIFLVYCVWWVHQSWFNTSIQKTSGWVPMACLSLSVLGTFEVTLAGQTVTAFGYDKVQALLVYLAVEADRPHRRETMAGLLWPELPESDAHHNLSQALFSLRRAIGDHQTTPPFLIITRHALQFNPASDYCLDVTDFTRLLAVCLAHRHPRLAACDACLERLAGALALYQGDFLAGFSAGDALAFEEWALLQRERLARLADEALGHLAGAYQERGEYRQALAYAWRRAELDPWREEACRSLMHLLALSGEREAALAQYAAFQGRLAAELSMQPALETRQLAELIRTGEFPGVPAFPLYSTPACPYRGLFAFHATDAPFFFGREAFSERLARAVSQQPMLAVIGPSGSGKSSVVFAGLLPRLRRGEEVWLTADFRPGRQRKLLLDFRQMDNITFYPNTCIIGTTMYGYVYPVSVPIIFGAWKLAPMNPYLQAS